MSGPSMADLMAAIKAVARNGSAEAWAAVLAPPMDSSGIVTPRRIAMFLGQCAHESAGFTVVSENLNYGAPGLVATFPRYFGADGDYDPADYARKPEAIANAVYGGRMGNGDEDSGDGWRFRGGGLIQLTGRQNYALFGASVGKSAEDAAEWVRTAPGAATSACWFWTKNGLNTLAEAWNMYAVTQRINGGQNGAATRAALCNAALATFKAG